VVKAQLSDDKNESKHVSFYRNEAQTGTFAVLTNYIDLHG
jgi:hypothetical protein